MERKIAQLKSNSCSSGKCGTNRRVNNANIQRSKSEGREDIRLDEENLRPEKGDGNILGDGGGGEDPGRALGSDLEGKTKEVSS